MVDWGGGGKEFAKNLRNYFNRKYMPKDWFYQMKSSENTAHFGIQLSSTFLSTIFLFFFFLPPLEHPHIPL